MTDFLQNYPRGIILTMDQLSLYFQATLTRVWAPKGQTPVVKLSPRRHHVHFYGALEVRTGREMALPADRQSAEITANFICRLLRLFPTQPILLLLDRAPWQVGPAISPVLVDNERLELSYYPPACPDLNPQEPVWSQVREAISHHHGYPQFHTLVDDFETYLNETPFDTNFMQKYAPAILCDF